jgi:hypothetical protein
MRYVAILRYVDFDMYCPDELVVQHIALEAKTMEEAIEECRVNSSYRGGWIMSDGIGSDGKELLRHRPQVPFVKANDIEIIEVSQTRFFKQDAGELVEVEERPDTWKEWKKRFPDPDQGGR